MDNKEKAAGLSTQAASEVSSDSHPAKAQAELRSLKHRLITGYCTGKLRAGFIARCFLEYPELVAT